MTQYFPGVFGILRLGTLVINFYCWIYLKTFSKGLIPVDFECFGESTTRGGIVLWLRASASASGNSWFSAQRCQALAVQFTKAAYAFIPQFLSSLKREIDNTSKVDISTANPTGFCGIT